MKIYIEVLPSLKKEESSISGFSLSSRVLRVAFGSGVRLSEGGTGGFLSGGMFFMWEKGDRGLDVRVGGSVRRVDGDIRESRESCFEEANSFLSISN